MTPRVVRLLTVIMIAALVMGCGNQTSGDMSVEEQKAMLAQRPTIDEITARYERMQAELRRRLANEIGISEWVKDTDGNASGCSDYPGIGGKSCGLGNWSSEGNLPDAQWPQAQAIATEVTGRYGFAPPEVVVNRPGDHFIVGTDQYGATYDFGTAVNTVLSVATGCHFPSEQSQP